MDGGLSDWFATAVGVLQGCILSPLLFNISLVLDGNEIGADITGHCISNLRFADDISVQEEDHGRSGWTISVKIAQRWTCPLFKHHVLPGTGLNEGTLFSTRAANARRRHRHRRLGTKSSKSSQVSMCVWVGGWVSGCVGVYNENS